MAFPPINSEDRLVQATFAGRLQAAAAASDLGSQLRLRPRARGGVVGRWRELLAVAAWSTPPRP